MKGALLWIRKHVLVLLASSFFLILLFSVSGFNTLFRHTMTEIDTQASYLNSVTYSQIRTDLDSVFNSSLDLVSMISTNNVVQEFSGIEQMETAAHHYNVYELLKSTSPYGHIVQNNRAIMDYLIYYPRSSILVNKSSYYPLPSFYNQWYTFEQLSLEQWEECLSANYSGSFVPELCTNSLLVYAQSVDRSPIPPTNILILFDRKGVESIIAEHQRDDFKIILCVGSLVVSADIPESLKDSFESYLAEPQEYPADNPWHISLLESNSIHSLTYYICSNDASGSGVLGSSLHKFYIIAILLMFFIAFFTFIASLAIVLSPYIVKHRKSYTETESSKSTSLLREAIDYVFCHNQEQKNDESEWLAVKDSLLDLMTDSGSSNDRVLSALEKHNIFFEHPYFLMTLFTLSSDNQNSFHRPFNCSIRNFGDDILYAWSAIGNSRVVALLNLRDQSTQYIPLIEHIRISLLQQTDSQITAYIGSIQHGSANIHKSYSDAVALFDYKIFTGGNCILDHNSYIASSDEYYYPMDVELNLISAVFRGDLESVCSVLQTIHDENFVNRQLSPYIAKLLLHELAGTTLKITHRSGYKYDQNPAATVLKCTTVEEVFFNLQKIYLKVCSDYQMISDEKNKAAFNQYIMDHYTDAEFSQSTMADSFNISQSYLSAQFKLYFGVNMNAYVNNLRVQLASTYLRESKESVQDIAIRCGFRSGDALGRVFKKICGVTPTDFRNSIDK